MLDILSALASDSYPFPLVTLWVHYVPMKLGVATWPTATNEGQGEGISGRKSWARCFLRSLSSALAVVWGCMEVMMPFNWGSWNAANMRETAALKSILNQVSLFVIVSETLGWLLTVAASSAWPFQDDSECFVPTQLLSQRENGLVLGQV